MPRREKNHEKNRLKNARLKKLSLLPKNKKIRRPSDPVQAEEWLRDVADHLSNLPNASHGYRFVAYAIKRYLRNSEMRDLHKELCLVHPPGKRRTFPERIAELDWARKTHQLKRDGQSLSQIANQLETDLRTLRRRHKKFLPQFEKEELLAPLSQAVREVLRERQNS